VREIVTFALMMSGALFMLLAGVGILRMPDLYMRISATTKAATLGAGLTLLALAVYFNQLGIASRALATIVFIFLTAPVAGHMIARAAYFLGVPLWKGTIANELRGRYDEKTHLLSSIRDRMEVCGPPEKSDVPDLE
jgi:multicomponent Na+:H+ antiporter subunit G